MSLFDSLKKISQKHAWTFTLVGIALSVLGVAASFYSIYSDQKRPHISIDVTNSETIFDIKEEISNLSIFLDGSDIRKNNELLRTVTIKISNTSNKDILQNHYDTSSPLGIEISNGRIIKTDFINASSEYIKENIKNTETYNRHINFPNIILESGEQFTIKILILHKEMEQPEINATGKIAGIKHIYATKSYQNKEENSLLKRAFYESLSIQIIRSISYSIILFISAVIIFIPIAATAESINRIKKKSYVKEFKSSTELEIDKEDEFILKRFIKNGPDEISYVYKTFIDEKKLEDAHELFDIYADLSDEDLAKRYNKAVDMDLKETDITSYFDEAQKMKKVKFLRAYLKGGILIDSGETFTTDPKLVNTLTRFHTFLKNRKIIKQDRNED